MENDEQLDSAPGPRAAASSEAGRHAGRHPQERLAQSDPPPPLAADREGAVEAELAQDPNGADWRYLYSIVRDRYQDERKRGDGLDQKIGVLLAGVIAAIAFTFENGPSSWWSLVLLVFLWPLWHVFQAFRTRVGVDAPKVETLADRFPYYPTTTLRVAVTDMVSARAIDRALNDEKANRLDRALAALLGAFVVGLIVQIGWRATEVPVASTMLKGASTPAIPLHAHATASRTGPSTSRGLR